VKEADGEPVDGGSISYATYAEPVALDPAELITNASTSGVEVAAVFDVLMRWDSESNEVVPQLAESLEPNDDFTEWTLKLRDGVQFSDGGTLDAAAVKASLERYVANGGSDAPVWTKNVTAVGTPDDLTVTFTLATSWPTFDFLLTGGPGMIVSPTSDAGGTFKPIGAGPFTLDSWAPNESMTLKANENYWGGRPHLDEVKAVFLVAPTTSYDSFKTGEVDMVFLRDADLVDAALEEGSSGYVNLTNAGSAAVINAQKGHPGADPRVRKALHLAVDSEIFRARVFAGKGIVSKDLFSDASVWNTGVTSLPYDPDEARKLLDEAKADGYDGKIRVSGSSEVLLTLTSLFEAVGFEVEGEEVKNPADQIKAVAIDRDYDVASWGLSIREAGPFGRMYALFGSEGNLTVGMHTGPEMDGLLSELQAAATLEEQKEVLGRIQEQWNEDVPALLFNPAVEMVAWKDELHGVVDTAASIVLLQDAWLS
jgi:peptide/nickel transport system substrate-binding protein